MNALKWIDRVFFFLANIMSASTLLQPTIIFLYINLTDEKLRLVRIVNVDPALRKLQ